MGCCGDKERRSRIRLILFLILTTIYFLVEVIVGHITGSMALVADAFHMLSDIVALVIAYISMVMSPKKWHKNTFGFARAEVLGALSNAVFLLALCFSILVEALKKFFTPETIENPQLVLIVGCAGLAINLVGLLLFHQHGHSHGGGGSHGHSHGLGHGHSHDSPITEKNHNHNHGDLQKIIEEEIEKNGNIISSSQSDLVKPPPSPVMSISDSPSPATAEKAAKVAAHKNHSSQMNIRGVFLHVLGDALGSVVVIISALVVWLSDWEHKEYVDPSLSIVIVIIIAISTIPLLKESSLVLLQTVPDYIDVTELREGLLKEVPQIQDIHEFHVWRLVGDRVICTLHAGLKSNVAYTEQMFVARKIKNFFHSEGIHSTTVQLELPTALPILSESSNEEDSRPPMTSSTGMALSPSSCALLCPPPTRAPTVTSMSDLESLDSCAQATCCRPIDPAHEHDSEDTLRHRHSHDHHHGRRTSSHNRLFTITKPFHISPSQHDLESNWQTKL